MSRAYRIEACESLSLDLSGDRSAAARLEWLPILPPAEMAVLLEAELTRLGFERSKDASDDGWLRRDVAGIFTEVQPSTGDVRVSCQLSETVHWESVATDVVCDPEDLDRAREQLQEELDRQQRREVESRRHQLQANAANRLTAALPTVRGQLRAVVNRVTAEALKRRAGQLGRIQSLEDDGQGNLSIVVEL